MATMPNSRPPNAPTPAMVEAAVTIAAPRAAAHDEDAHRRLLVDTVGDSLEPAVEPAPAQFKEILREVCHRPERRGQIPPRRHGSTSGRHGSPAQGSAASRCALLAIGRR